MPYLAFALENGIFKWLQIELGRYFLKIIQQLIQIYSYCFNLTACGPFKQEEGDGELEAF